MDREKIIGEIKAEYQKLASQESRDHFVGQPGAPSPQSDYETLLNEVLGAVEAGAFDHCHSGKEVVELVANNRGKWGIGK